MGEDREFRLADPGKDLLTRDQGARVRRILMSELAAWQDTDRLVVSLEGVDAVTSSFVDERLGRLLLETGPNRFRSSIRLRTSEESIRRPADHVPSHRLRDAGLEPTS